jgi:hypothetical protein
MYSPRQRARYLAICAAAASSTPVSNSDPDLAVSAAIEELLSASRERAAVRQITLGYLEGLRHEAVKSRAWLATASRVGTKANLLRASAELNSRMEAYFARKTLGDAKVQKVEEPKKKSCGEHRPWNVVDADKEDKEELEEFCAVLGGDGDGDAELREEVQGWQKRWAEVE